MNMVNHCAAKEPGNSPQELVETKNRAKKNVKQLQTNGNVTLWHLNTQTTAHMFTWGDNVSMQVSQITQPFQMVNVGLKPRCCIRTLPKPASLQLDKYLNICDDWQLYIQCLRPDVTATFRWEPKEVLRVDTHPDSLPAELFFWKMDNILLNKTACGILHSLLLHISVDAAPHHPAAVGQKMVTTLSD